MSASEWKMKCEEEWGLQGAPMPDSVDWKSVYEARPLGRNLLKNPSPHGFSKDMPPPNPERKWSMERYFHHPSEVDFSSWNISREYLPRDRSGIPSTAVVCGWTSQIWLSMEQIVDLKEEGLWDELLDEFQPEIVIQDWYEESRMNEHIYELHVKLLGAENDTVIAEHSVRPTEDLNSDSYIWKEVSHVFSGYGPGVRYIHFQHRLKEKVGEGIARGFHKTLVTDSSVIVRPTKTSSQSS
ncbi:F-box only protein 50-like [Halichoeres trimaculatus]|uniref:F-box only protein 50-like n=1 Tax=Halichoeres trimaculatus TaxID=147232 RepID=UPI003D9E6130